MLLVSMVNGIIRNAVAFWIPTFLSERLGFSPALSASISGGLPLVNLAGTFLGLVILKKLRETSSGPSASCSEHLLLHLP